MWQVKSLTFCLAHLFPVKPQVCNAGANCSNSNLILCKIAFVSLVTVDIVNSISRTVVNIIVLCKGPSGLVTKLNNKKKIGGPLCPPPYRFFLCCIETICSREMKLSDF